MLRKRITLGGLAYFALSALPALADGEAVAPAPASPSSESRWTGFYVGAGGGAGKVDQSVSGSSSELISVDKYKKHCHWVAYWPYHQCEYKPDGHEDFGPYTQTGNYESDDWKGFGTIQFGADYLIHDRILIGAFADVDLYGNAENAFSFKDCDLSVTGNLDLKRVWNLGGRIGVLAHPDFLLYAVGGYSRADIESATQVDFKHGPTLDLTPDDSLRGYFVGGGAEWMIHKNLSLKVEYRWARYRDESVSASAVSDPYTIKSWDHKEKYEVTKSYGADAEFDADIQTIRAALVLHLDRDEPAPAPLK